MEDNIIHYVEVYLEEPEKNLGIKRLCSVIAYNCRHHKIKDYQELIDNAEFHYDENNVREEIRAYVSSKIGIKSAIVNVMN